MSQPFDQSIPTSPEVSPAFSPVDIARRIHINLVTSEQPARRNYQSIGTLMAYGALTAASMYTQVRHGLGLDTPDLSASPNTHAAPHMPDHQLVADTTSGASDTSGVSPSPKPGTHESAAPWLYPRTNSTDKHDVEFNTVYPSYFDNREQEADTAHNRDLVEGFACGALTVGVVAGSIIYFLSRGRFNKYAILERKGKRERARGETATSPSRDPHLEGETWPAADAPTYGPHAPGDIVPGMK